MEDDMKVNTKTIRSMASESTLGQTDVNTKAYGSKGNSDGKVDYTKYFQKPESANFIDPSAGGFNRPEGFDECLELIKSRFENSQY
jgi:hypothetical protein